MIPKKLASSFIGILLKLVVATEMIPGRCLVQSDAISGVEQGSVFSNKYEIIGHPSDLWLGSFKHCIDERGNLIGMQYILKSEGGTQQSLSAVGKIEGECRDIDIEGDIDRIKVSYSNQYGSVNSIKYYKGR